MIENLKSVVNARKLFENSEFGTIRTCLIEGEPWFVGNDIANTLGYKYPKDAIRDNVRKCDKQLIHLSNIQNDLSDNMKSSKITIINKIGVYNLITKSNVIDIKTKEMYLSKLGLNYIPYDRKEISFKRNLIDFLDALNIDIIHQFRVGNYRVDFYIPLYRIAIEYDEHDHSGYDKNDEVIRQKCIEEKLGCTFVRLSDKKSDSYNLGIVSKYLR